MSLKPVKTQRIIVPRITQLDANKLDDEIFKILYNETLEIAQFLKPGTLNNIKDELKLLLRLLIFKYSVIQSNATFGQQLLGLKYDNMLRKSQLFIYLMLNYLLPYFKSKYDESNNSFTNYQPVSITLVKIIKHIEIFSKVFNLLNLLYFLKEGIYSTLNNRLLKLKYAPENKLSRNVDYSFMSRQLIWHSFTELLEQIIPSVNYGAIRRKIKMLFLSKKIKVKENMLPLVSDTIKCVICEDYPTIPCAISMYCPHTACYYCLKSCIMSDEKFMCPECAEVNTVSENMIYL